MTETLFSSLNYWHWWILAGFLLLLELPAPGVVFLWLGLAAANGFVALAVPGLAWEAQFLLFLILGAAASVAGRLAVRHRRAADHPPPGRGEEPT
jgi:membrane protein implicated in regulation of membrane protease activity